MIYLYAITQQRSPSLEAVRGLDAAPLRALPVASGLGAVVSTAPPPPVMPTPQRLWQHEQVVEGLMTCGPVIPVRFATLYPSEDALLHRLEHQQEEIAAHLDRLRGCVELGLRVLRMVEPPPFEASGDGLPCPDLLGSEKKGRTFEIARQAAFLQRDTLQRRDESLAEILNRSLSEVAVDHRCRVEAATGTLLHAAYLVEQRRLKQMQEAVFHLVQQHPSLHFLCTGPWPPYHFVPDFRGQASLTS